MATLDFAATVTPRDLAGEVGLYEFTRYRLVNITLTATVYVREAAAAPVAGARGAAVEASGFYEFVAIPDQGVWVWTDDANGCTCIVREVIG